MTAPLLTSTHWGVYEVEAREGRVVALHPFRHDPDPSAIGSGMPEALHSRARVLRPAVRRSVLEHGPGAARERRGAEPFIEVDWDVALDLVAGEITRVRTQHGNASIFGGSYGWSSAGRFHHAQSQVHRFLNCCGGYVRHVTSYSLGAGRTLMPHVVMPIDEVQARQTAWSVIEEHTTLLVAFGGVPARNLQVNAGGAAQHESASAMARLARSGVACVNVGAATSDMSAGPGVEWLSIRPNTDTAVMLGLAHTLITEGLHDEAFLARYTVGFAPLRDYILGHGDGVPKSVEWAGAIADAAPERLRELARRMARSRTMINASWSLQRADHGEQPFWMTVALACLLGQVGLPGGGFGFGYGAVNAVGAWASAFSGPVLPQGDNAVQAFIPVARLTDMLLSPGAPFAYDGKMQRYPDARLVYWCGGNPFHHHQDLNRLLLAWRRPETIVVHEQFWTATAKHADIVLPATTSLERDDLGSASRDRFVIAMRRAAPAPGLARDDFEIFRDLAQRLGVEHAFTEGRTAREWLVHLYERSRERAAGAGIDLPAFDVLWEQGFAEIPRPPQPPVLLQEFRADPERHRLPTPSGRIELHSATIAGFGYANCPGHPVWQEPQEWLGSALAQRFPLHLLSHQPVTRLHSQYDHVGVSRRAKIAGREPVALHPDDAHARGLVPGDVVRVYNDRGACLAGLRTDPGLRRGVALLATGAWYDPQEPGVSGTLDKHGNPNMLCPDRGASDLSQGCSAHSCLVEIERFTQAPPTVTAFDPPAFVARRRRRMGDDPAPPPTAS
ncbi:MAG: molybdopterin guanine dinucleotide-containing S/N-oxide reductase [Burkholderiales bacterium]|nr:molybdopterin guanine dinucleotide-containing S/N-oxide reductase [Burkholderiales bacterium]